MFFVTQWTKLKTCHDFCFTSIFTLQAYPSEYCFMTTKLQTPSFWNFACNTVYIPFSLKHFFVCLCTIDSNSFMLVVGTRLLSSSLFSLETGKCVFPLIYLIYPVYTQSVLVNLLTCSCKPLNFCGASCTTGTPISFGNFGCHINMSVSLYVHVFRYLYIHITVQDK